MAKLRISPTPELKAVNPETAAPSKPKVLVFGKPGVGKTWTSLDFPKVYYIDTEGGANLAHYTDKLKASGGGYLGIEQGSLDFGTIIGQVEALACRSHEYRTLVIDSISRLFDIEQAKESERLGDKDGYGAAKKPAITYTRRLFNWLDRLDMNVILIAHEKPQWYKGEQIGVTYDAWDKIEYILHLCLNIQKLGEARNAFVKKSRLKGFPDGSIFPWSYAEFAQRYGKEVMEQKAIQLTLATPEQLAVLEHLLQTVKVHDKELEAWYTKAKVTSFDEMDEDKIAKIINHLKNKISQPTEGESK